MKGFSLMEVLIAMSVAVVAGVLLMGMWVQNNNVFYKEQAVSSQQVNVNDVSDQISLSIRSAASVATSLSHNSVLYTTGLEALVLTIPSIDANQKVIEDTFDHIIIAKDSQNTKVLKKFVVPNGASNRKSENKVLTTKLSEINFYYLDQNNLAVSPTSAAKINFSFKVLENYGGKTEESSKSGQVNLRND